MKTLIKFGFVIYAALTFAGCGKTEFDNVAPDTAGNTNQTLKYNHSGDMGTGGDLFVDKDKCKKCHSAPKAMGIDWNAPYMGDSRYSSIEELINDFDFINNVHGRFVNGRAGNPTISEAQKQDLIRYLESIAAEANSSRK